MIKTLITMLLGVAIFASCSKKDSNTKTESKIEYLELNKSYKSRNGIEVIVKDIVKSTTQGGKIQYYIEYATTNNTNSIKTEHGFRAYYKNKVGGINQSGTFGKIYLNQTRENSFVFTTTIEYPFNTLEFDYENSNSNSPLPSSLKWNLDL